MTRIFQRSPPALLVSAALLMAACAAPAPVPAPAAGGPPRVLLALNVAGGGAPSPHQVEKIHEAIVPVMNEAGMQLAESLERADYVLTVVFTPDPVDPDGGRLAVRGIEPARPWRDKAASNPSAGQLKEMEARVNDLERWAVRGQLGR